MKEGERVIAALSILIILLTFILFVFALVVIDIRRENFFLQDMLLKTQNESIELITQCIVEPLPKLKSKPKPKPKPKPRPPGIRV